MVLALLFEQTLMPFTQEVALPSDKKILLGPKHAQYPLFAVLPQ